VDWIVVVAWVSAVVVSAVVLGFCAYELGWKARRLRADLATLERLGDSLRRLQQDVTAAQQRLAAPAQPE
jgi:hypothetical protein